LLSEHFSGSELAYKLWHCCTDKQFQIKLHWKRNVCDWNITEMNSSVNKNL